MHRTRNSPFARWVMTRVLAIGLLAQLCAGADMEPKIVLDFEDQAEVNGLKPNSENVTLDIVQDYGVTSGKNCLRVVGKMGQAWAGLVLNDPAKMKDCEKYDYLGLDVYSAQDAEIEPQAQRHAHRMEARGDEAFDGPLLREFDIDMKGLRIPLAREFDDAGLGHGHAAAHEAVADHEILEVAVAHRTSSR